MNKFFTKHDKQAYATYSKEMYTARAQVFKTRLRWDVTEENGMEIDKYDKFYSPTYFVACNHSGKTTASLRILPTTGPTMLEQEFNGFFAEPLDIASPTVWECTRLCTHADNLVNKADSMVASKQLLKFLFEVASQHGVEQIVGVYFKKMEKVFKKIGWSPEPFCEGTGNFSDILTGIWMVDEKSAESLFSNQGI